MKDLHHSDRVRRCRLVIPHSTAPRGICRWCGLPIMRPDGRPDRRRNWHPECVESYKLCWPGHARQRVKERDGGICAGCGRDTVTRRLRKSRPVRRGWTTPAMSAPTAGRCGLSGTPGSWTTSSRWRTAARTSCPTCRRFAGPATGPRRRWKRRSGHGDDGRQRGGEYNLRALPPRHHHPVCHSYATRPSTLGIRSRSSGPQLGYHAFAINGRRAERSTAERRS
jgi:hypothetical protein